MPFPDPPPEGWRLMFEYASLSGATSSWRKGRSRVDPVSVMVTGEAGLPAAPPPERVLGVCAAVPHAVRAATAQIPTTASRVTVMASSLHLTHRRPLGW